MVAAASFQSTIAAPAVASPIITAVSSVVVVDAPAASHSTDLRQIVRTRWAGLPAGTL